MDSNEVLTALGGAGAMLVLAIGAFRWMADRIADRLAKRVEHTYDKLLEHERAELTALTQITGAAASVPSASFLAGYSRRLDSIERMWTALIQIRRMYGRAIGLYDVVLERELLDITASSPLIAGMPAGTDAFLSTHGNPPDCEEVRPLIGEYLWVRFFIYRAFCARLGFRVADGISGGELLPWDRGFHGDDDPLVQLLGTVLSEEQVTALRKEPLGGPSLALRLIESQILAEIDRVLSGSQATSLSITEGKRPAEAVWTAERAANMPIKQPA